MSGTTTVLTADAASAADAALAQLVADLTVRVAALEQGVVKPPIPPGPTPSADGAKATAPGTILVDDALNQWQLVPYATFGNIVQWMPAGTSAWVAAGYSANVTAIEKWHATCYQTNGTGWWSWDGTTWQTAPGDPSAPVVTPPIVIPPVTGSFTVTQANGIRDNAGNRWELRGYNCDWDKFGGVKASLYRNFPGANLVRVVCTRTTTPANISPMISELTARKMICFIDYHDTVYGGTIAWYQGMVAAFKANPYAWLETPNEPTANVAPDQIAIINAIRAAGWINPIGLELHGGYMFDNIALVMAAVAQGNQIFLCPHNYGDWWNGNMQNGANATGLYSVVDEFGDSTDGSNVDANGTACVQHIIQSQQAHQNGAAFWSATNNWHEGDNLFLDPQGATLSSMGKLIQQMGWLA